MKTGLAMSKEWHCFFKQTELTRKQKKGQFCYKVLDQTYKLLKSLSVLSKPADETF